MRVLFILALIFWILLIVADIILIMNLLDIYVFSKLFKKRINARVKKLENKVYKEDK